jgi:hypothetical protein
MEGYLVQLQGQIVESQKITRGKFLEASGFPGAWHLNRKDSHVKEMDDLIHRCLDTAEAE